MVVKDDAELGGEDAPAGRAQGRAAGEIDHPQVVGRGSLKGFLRTALQPPGVQAAPIIAVVFQIAVNRTQRGRGVAVSLPVPIEHPQGRGRIFPDPLKKSEWLNFPARWTRI